MPITVLLADDRPEIRGLVRAYLAVNFRQDIVVAGEAEDGAAALRLVERLRPDLVILDDEMPVLSGTAAIAGLRRAAPATFIILYSAGAHDVAALLHPPDRHVDKADGLGPLGVAIAEGVRTIAARVAPPARRVAGG
jgi:chemotaxis response regulator CheB